MRGAAPRGKKWSQQPRHRHRWGRGALPPLGIAGGLRSGFGFRVSILGDGEDCTEEDGEELDGHAGGEAHDGVGDDDDTGDPALGDAAIVWVRVRRLA